MVLRWSKVVLKGGDHRIPRLCPNCLGPGEVELRCSYRAPWSLGFLPSYHQTFLYCRHCFPQADSVDLLKRRRDLSYILGLVAIIPFSLMLGDADRRFAVSLILSAGTGLAFFIGARHFIRARNPKREAQALWGVAAYYTGTAWHDLGDATAVYRAARPEWIAALVKANPECVDDDTFYRLVGTSPQGPASTPRPFGLPR